MNSHDAQASDAELLARAGAGDRQAFDQIVMRRGGFALRVARRLSGDATLAEDLVQEALVRAWRQAPSYDSRRGRFTTWLYRILVNLWVDERRRRWPEPLPADLDPPDPAHAAEERLALEQRDRALLQTLQRLPPRERAATTLIYDEGLTGAEAARALGTSVKAIERLLARARRNLRESLERAEL
jgi:RNA polymerase sigma-70 factor, ECF subfamily